MFSFGNGIIQKAFPLFYHVTEENMHFPLLFPLYYGSLGGFKPSLVAKHRGFTFV